MADQNNNQNTSQAQSTSSAQQPQQTAGQAQSAPVYASAQTTSSAPAQTTAVQPKTSGLGVASLVLGIVGIVGSWIPILNNASFFIAGLGLVFGIIGIVLINKSNGKKKGKGLAIAGTVVSIFAVIIVLATQSMYGQVADNASKSLDKMTGDATQELLGKEVSVDFSAYTIDTKMSGSYESKEGYLSVTVKNLASESKSYSVKVEAVDANGNRIDEGYVYASTLGSNQSKTEKIFNTFGSDNVTKYDGATFKVLEVSQY